MRLSGGEPGQLIAVRAGQAAVQDEGSQLCALALANAPIDGRDERWLDLCAGPGGKTALLAALSAQREAKVTANELRPHRANLVRQATAKWNVSVRVGDGRDYPEIDGGFDRVLVDGAVHRGLARCAGGRRRDGVASPPISPSLPTCNASCSLPR